MCETDDMKPTADLSVAAALAAAPPAIKTVAFLDRRLNREWQTMAAMVKIYCRDRHGATAALCANCAGLLAYASVRLDRCRFGAEKPTCAMCPVHCYQRDRREQVRVIMRCAGPRMLWEHPLMSLWHWLDSFRHAPAL